VDHLEQFRQFYAQWYAPKEWEVLEAALLHPPEKISRHFPHCHQDYILDRASLLPVELLAPQPGERILDLCAAPGGKSLLIAEAMAFQGQLDCNDVSQERLTRLRKVFRDYEVPESKEGWRVLFSHGSGRACAAHAEEPYDGILVDAPCSSESHVLRRSAELRKWSSSRSQLLAKRQRKLLAAALKACRSGGRVVYATCSISPLENESVVEKVAQKLGSTVQVEATRLVLPHRDQMGPMYMAHFRKF
jgi:5-methylcytosine rRNA methyltransferase NSUN4